MRFFAARSFQIASIAGFSWGGSSTKLDEKPRTCPIQISIPEKANNDVLLSRKIVNHLDRSNLKLRLYQYETCPFCCKVRAFLDYYGFSYEVVEVNPVTRSQIKFSTAYKKVPILRSGENTTLTESSLIISELATYLTRPDQTLESIEKMYPAVDSVNEKGKPCLTYPNKFFVMKGEVGSEKDMALAREEREWREWVDNWFIHLISPNVYRTWEESLETFKWFEKVGEWHRTFPDWERVLAVYIGAAAMFLLSKTLKKKHNIVDEREELRKACREWMEAIGPSRQFLGGDRPNLADLSLYGAMNSFYGCAAFKEVILNEKIADWMMNVEVDVESQPDVDLPIPSPQLPDIVEPREEPEVKEDSVEPEDSEEAEDSEDAEDSVQLGEAEVQVAPRNSAPNDDDGTGSDTTTYGSEHWQTVNRVDRGLLLKMEQLLTDGHSTADIIHKLFPEFNVDLDRFSENVLMGLLMDLMESAPVREKLPQYNTFEDAIELFRTKKNILMLTGAGVSVSCGIPDFRSKDGIYARLHVDFPDLPNPTAMFDIRYFRSNPKPFYNFAKEIFPGQFNPSIAHRFIKVLEDDEKLLRNYTQNIDTLERQTGITRVVECHGSFSKATCLNCGAKYDGEIIREDVMAQRVAKCRVCDDGVIKPNIVFFGEDLAQDFHRQISEDKNNVDLVVVIGSSLNVRPVSLIPFSVDENVPQILINREPLRNYRADIELLGNCDDILREICLALGGRYERMIREYDEALPVRPIQTPRTFLTSEQLQEKINEHCDAIQKKDAQEEAAEENEEPPMKRPKPDEPSTSMVGMFASKFENVTAVLPPHSYAHVSENQTVFPGAELSFDVDSRMIVKISRRVGGDSESISFDSDFSDDAPERCRSAGCVDTNHSEVINDNGESCPPFLEYEESGPITATGFREYAVKYLGTK
ncbi:unnamed protein product [Caenorhabditis bovis]|uniref:NAD-dependent protein deacetylase sir-2.1 n=1 Tax=Caenorhabditis bovis TaxID=2654633 RepID=A0A8S1EXQ3_9PELO|nr:unnamed protein product [Caenorhabditis bovis]